MGSPAQIWYTFSQLNSCSLPASPSVELPCLSVHFIWTLASYFLYHILCLISASAVCCQTPLYRALWPVLPGSGYLCVTDNFFLFLSYFQNNELIPVKLPGISCELKYGIHPISAWNDGMILKCCIFLLWDIQYLEISSEIEYIYCNYYLPVSFDWHPNKNLLIVKQSVGVEVWCFYSKGSDCQRRWIEQLIYLN